MAHYQDLAFLYLPPTAPPAQGHRQTTTSMNQHWPGHPISSWQAVSETYKHVNQDFVQMVPTYAGTNPSGHHYLEHGENWERQQFHDLPIPAELHGLPQHKIMNGPEQSSHAHTYPERPLILSPERATHAAVEQPIGTQTMTDLKPISKNGIDGHVGSDACYSEGQQALGADLHLSDAVHPQDSDIVTCQLICSHSSGPCAMGDEEASFRVEVQNACVIKLTQEGRYPAYVLAHEDGVSNVEQMNMDSIETAEKAEVSITEEGIKIVSLLPETTIEKDCAENKITYIVKSKVQEVITVQDIPGATKAEFTEQAENSQEQVQMEETKPTSDNLTSAAQHDQETLPVKGSWKLLGWSKSGRFKRSTRSSARLKERNTKGKHKMVSTEKPKVNVSAEEVVKIKMEDKEVDIKIEAEDHAEPGDRMQSPSFLVNDQWMWPKDFPAKHYYCDICQDDHSRPCRLLRHKATVEDNISCVNSKIRAIASLPNELSLSLSECSTHGLSVFAATEIPARTLFGPLVGEPMKEEDTRRDWNLQYIWFLDFLWDKCETLLDTQNELTSNWCRYLRPTVDIKNANLMGIKKGEQLFFVSTCTLEAGDELIYYISSMTKAFRTHAHLSQWPIEEQFEEFSSCFKCNVSFHCAFNFAKHMKLVHPKGINKVCQKCKFCNIRLESMKALECHFRTEHGGVGCFDCAKCDKSYLTMHRLRQHIKMSHYKGGSLVCEECGKVLPTPSKLKEHIRIKHSMERFPCDYEQCSKVFTTRTSLFRHKKSHEKGPMNFLCNTCGKTFRDGTNLKVHLLIHSGVKPFQCREAQCSAAFTTKQCLQFHYRKVHNYSLESVPVIQRKVPFTVAAYTSTREEGGDVEEGHDRGSSEAMDASTTLLRLNQVVSVPMVQGLQDDQGQLFQ